MTNDLPPGCGVNDIPGNTPEDIRFENLLETIPHGQKLCSFALEKLAKWIIEREEKAYEAGYQQGRFEERDSSIEI